MSIFSNLQNALISESYSGNLEEKILADDANQQKTLKATDYPKQIDMPNLFLESPLSMIDISFSGMIAGIALSACNQFELATASYAIGILPIVMRSASTLLDMHASKDVVLIDLKSDYGVDVNNLRLMPREERLKEARTLTKLLNDSYTAKKYCMKELRKKTNSALTEYISSVTGQIVNTKDGIQKTMSLGIFHPFARGGNLPIGSEVYFGKDHGIFNPFTLAHEFVHRRDYTAEYECQIIAYKALVSSEDPVLVQSAYSERLLRQLQILKYHENDESEFNEVYDVLRPEIKKDFEELMFPKKNIFERIGLLNSENKKLNPDYCEKFTDSLHAMGDKIV